MSGIEYWRHRSEPRHVTATDPRGTITFWSWEPVGVFNAAELDEQYHVEESEIAKVAAQRAVRIRELEAERDMARQEYHELEEFHRLYIDPYKGDDGGIEAAKSYLIGRLRELNRGYKQRAKQAEARLDKIREHCKDLAEYDGDDPDLLERGIAAEEILKIMDGEA